MEEVSFFLAAISEQYGQHPVALHPLRRKNPEGKRLVSYRLRAGIFLGYANLSTELQQHSYVSLAQPFPFDQVDLLKHEFSPQYRPDPQRIAAVVNEYYHRRHLLPEERDVLLAAIRFSIVWRGASFFSLIERSGSNEWIESALRSWNQWYIISEEIAHIAQLAIEQG